MTTPRSDRSKLARRVGFDPDYLAAFEEKMFIEGDSTRRRLTDFFVLLLLATVIATYGLLSNSSATVIGAMIVAPLMGPIMAAGAAVVMGSRVRAGRAMALVIAGVASVIGLSVALTLIVPDATISFADNPELAARTAPGLMALFTALAAGAAGAFIVGHEEIADSMGGVAIAISLVPPLCVVGIALAQGESASAAGAMLLFLTNLLAILLAGGVIFFVGGLGRLALAEAETRLRRNAFALIVLATLVVAIPLTATAYRSTIDAVADDRASAAAEDWLAGTQQRLVSVDVDRQLVTVAVEGTGALRPLPQLAGELAATLERPVVVRLRAIPVEIAASSGG